MEKIVKRLSEKYNKNPRMVEEMIKVCNRRGVSTENAEKYITEYFDKVCNKVCSREEKLENVR